MDFVEHNQRELRKAQVVLSDLARREDAGANRRAIVTRQKQDGVRGIIRQYRRFLRVNRLTIGDRPATSVCAVFERRIVDAAVSAYLDGVMLPAALAETIHSLVDVMYGEEKI